MKKLTLPKRRRKDDDVAIPRITNQTVAEHREQVIGRARRFIYPLQHSKRRVVTISVALFVVAVIVFVTSCVLALYKFQSTSGFMYDVTKVIPFPVARADGRYVSYESYLFELRRYQHYYENQQKLDFDTDDGKKQLANYKQQALRKVEDDAYVKVLAKQHNVTVSDREVDDEVTLLRNQNRLGASQQVFEDVLQEYWGWSVDDFKRELRGQLLAQKVAAQLDNEANARAEAALKALQGGVDFATVAGQYSDDQATKANGGLYTQAIERGNQTIAPDVLAALFKLQPGQYSSVVNAGESLQIVKVDSIASDGKLTARAIICNFKPIDTYIAPERRDHPATAYIKV